MRIYLRKNKEAYSRGRNPKTTTNNPLWKDIIELDGKEFVMKAWPFNNKFGRQDLLINLEVNDGQDQKEG
tara:strand:+ start:229 stop:438 length:210 start_codon:yes stop_codon:yes gene_type:complete